MHINNFDQSSTGLNLELNCWYDTDLSNIWFDEKFHILEHASTSDCESVLLYGKDQGITEDWGKEIIDLDDFSQEQHYTAIKSTGYSQGDYAKIIIPNEIEYTPSQEHIDHLIWGSPLYCRLEIDGIEFDLTEWLDDLYTYDKNTVIERFDQNVKHSRKDEILAFLKEQLPDHPDYN